MDQIDQTYSRIIILAFSIPGSGKSYFCNLLKNSLSQKNNVVFQVVSSDEIRKQASEQYAKSNNCSFDEAFDHTAKPAQKEFLSQISQCIQMNLAPNQQQVIFIDKNHLPNNIDITVQTIKSNNWTGKIICLVPNSEQSFNRMPLSISFIIHAINNSINRGNHLTLNGSDEKKVQIILMMAKNFQNKKLDKSGIIEMSKYGEFFTEIIGIGYHKLDIGKDMELKEKFGKVLFELMKTKFGSPFGEIFNDWIKGVQEVEIEHGNVELQVGKIINMLN